MQTLEKWVSEEKLRIERFAVYYLEQAKAAEGTMGEEAQNWPLDQNAGEWDEQYMMFDDPGPSPTGNTLSTSP